MVCASETPALFFDMCFFFFFSSSRFASPNLSGWLVLEDDPLNFLIFRIFAGVVIFLASRPIRDTADSLYPRYKT